ncbi:hypothetical protein [Maritalea myrionectae]|uniref:Uncharacterized protein n=1 Tax=Maritalea myrionectae TaxID=454601 RepID=A0A2R4MEU1_9HYPH|nr:hypothetical protein [Maritalea myrionectae]AVX04561.1 hypothetical protein MXMO3_02040 [Maritalea myrionectae]
MAERFMGIELNARNIMLAIAFMVGTYISIRLIAFFAAFLTNGIFGLVVSAAIGLVLFYAFMRGRR